MAINHISEILIKVHLDENKVPEKLEWNAQDGSIQNTDTKAFLLSFWDAANKETLKMDLWTKDMPLEDMKFFFYQTLLSMSETFLKATSDQRMTDSMRDFADYFAEKMELIEKK